MQVKGLSSSCIERIMQERKEGRFVSLADFLKRASPSFNDARYLAMARCFGSVRGDDKRSLVSIMWEIYFHFAILSGALKHFNTLPASIPSFSEYHKGQLVDWEMEYLQVMMLLFTCFLVRV